jgi:hypothetical protein
MGKRTILLVGGDDMDESMTMWGRIAGTAITALKEQISRLQKERDELESELGKSVLSEGPWRRVRDDPPMPGEPVLVFNENDASAGYMLNNGFWITKNLNGEVKYWMPLPEKMRGKPIIKDES